MDPAMMQNSKKLLNNFKDIRKDLYNTDGPGRKKHVQTWVSNVTQLDSSLQKENQQIKGVHVTDNSGKGDSGMKQDPFLNLFDRLRNEISEMIDKNCPIILNLPKIKGVNNYKLDEKDNKLFWKKENSHLKQKLNEMLSNMSMTVDEKFENIGRLLNLKDTLQQQLMQGLSYQKMVAWNDLNIKLQASPDSDEIYDHSKAVELHKKMADFMDKQKFLPRKLALELPDLDNLSGPYTGDCGGFQFDSIETCVCLNNQFTDMIDLIKTSFLFSEEKKEQFRKNNTVQQTMRQDLEDLHEVMIDQKEQFRKLQEQLSKSDSASKDQDELAVRCKELDHKAIQLEEALEQERTKYKESTAKLLDLKRKHKQLDEVHNKMKNSVVPKVTATKEYHKELAGHISQIREDSAMLPDMFRQLVKDSNELAGQKDEAIKARDFALQSDKLLRRQVKNLSEELDRKRRLAMQAIAARSGIKGELDTQAKKLQDHQLEIDDMKQEKQEAQIERDRYATKHDEMFNSVSNLNARIEELENHKLHLLQKLKKYGDKGGLEYIIKTQKLEGVRGKEFKERVQVEDYKPEDARAQRDAEYAQRQAEDAEGGVN